ncbi:MAG: hypothetical protein B7Z66_06485 [Chromatiales bacterium 21-64-14]|nr:MAG: hypothetical protein B7Z66_06485 [Chromatiales bacterium 21-64-14]HQU16936.1 mechanosensitive ion channel [Gammaproteobacteria bacterium]
MDIYPDWSTALRGVFSQLTERLVHFMPNLLGALALLLAGWITARLLRSVTIRLAHLLDGVLARFSRARDVPRAKVSPASTRILGSIVFWVVMLFFVTAATQVLGLDAFSTWLNRVVIYLPTLIAGALIVIAGLLVSSLARDLVLAAPVLTTPGQRGALARMVQLAILAAALLIGAEQIGLDVTFLVILATVVTATLLGGVALAVSLGARTLVSNLIGAQYLRQSYRVGQTVRIGAYQGTILDLTATSVVLETPEGRVTLPAKVFNEEPTLLLIGRGADG